ncbi:MAG: hypothetical protein ACOC8X_03825, partial [Chloroflexota bacterium]
PGHVTQYVLYLESEFAASIKFQRYRNTDLSDRPHSVRKPSTIFDRPAGISYRSPIADEQYLGCGVDVVPACRAGMRYGSYFVYFYFDLTADYYSDFGIDVDDLSQSAVSAIERDKGGLTLAGVEMVLKAMDKRYAELFDVELPADETE